MVFAALLLSLGFGRGALRPLPFLIGAEWSGGAPEAAQQLFLETGCNFVRLTGGGYGWSTGPHVAALKFLQPHGILALAQLGSHWPDGSYLDRSQDYFVDQTGQSGKHQGSAVDYSGQDWPQFSYASSEFRQKLTGDFTNYLNAIKPFDNVAGLLLHNEPGYFWVQGRVFDYNPQAIARFRLWLPTVYASIGDLNRTWGSSFSSFDQVDPPHEAPPVKQIAAWMDWRRFNAWLVQDFLQWESEFARQQRPDLPNMTNMSGPVDNWYALRLGNNYGFASASDAACIDIYASEWTSRFFPGFAMDMSRGVAQGRPVVVAECQSYDEGNFPALSDQQRGDRLESDLWTYIGHGARGILIWTLSGQDGFKLTRGEFNPRVKALRQTAHLAKMLRMDDFHRASARVALCVDQDAFVYFGGLDTVPGGESVSVYQSVQGLYAGLVQAGYDVDLICSDDVRAGHAARYDALVLATPAMMDGPLAEQLTAYTRNGGLLIAESPLAQWDRHGAPADQAALGLDRLFGLQLTPPAANARGKPGYGWNLAGVVSPHGAQPVDFGAGSKLSAFEHPFGKGKTVMFPVNVGIANSNGENPELAADLSRLLTRKDASPITVKADGYVDARTLTDASGNTLVVLTNPTDKKDPIHAKTDVVVGFPTGLIPAGAAVFGFGAEGAYPAKLSPQGELKIADLGPAQVFLIARNHGPLLSERWATAGVAGKPMQAEVTVFNPSARPVAGTLTLSAPSDWTCSSKSVQVPARGSSTITLIAKPGSANPRAVVKAILRPASGDPVTGLPIDVAITRE